jgi:transposase
MAREIADGESEFDLPAEAANVVAVLAGQLLQLHEVVRVKDVMAKPVGSGTRTTQGMS